MVCYTKKLKVKIQAWYF